MAEYSTASYVKLIRDFLDRTISAAAFEEEFIRRWKEDTNLSMGLEYAVLERLFEDCDAHWEGGKTKYTIDESELRECAAVALRSLESKGVPRTD